MRLFEDNCLHFSIQSASDLIQSASDPKCGLATFPPSFFLRIFLPTFSSEIPPHLFLDNHHEQADFRGGGKGVQHRDSSLASKPDRQRSVGCCSNDTCCMDMSASASGAHTRIEDGARTRIEWSVAQEVPLVHPVQLQYHHAVQLQYHNCSTTIQYNCSTHNILFQTPENDSLYQAK